MLYVVGLGPGGKAQMSFRAFEVLKACDVIVGYTTYIALIKDLGLNKELVCTGMKKEIQRCQKALELAAEGKQVAVISSGDAGVYGMAGLVLELAAKRTQEIQVEVVPGITASLGAAALLGAPLMNDFCQISLSDLMTPMAMIEKRLRLAAEGDFVICLYNPRSHGRPQHLAKAITIIRQFKRPETIVGICKNVGRVGEMTQITTLEELDDTLVDMTTLVIVGNKETYVVADKMITPRGYQL